MEIRYVVKKEFKYGAKVYKPGDEWLPQGGKFDTQIIRNHVRSEIVVAEAEVKHGENTRKQRVRNLV